MLAWSLLAVGQPGVAAEAAAIGSHPPRPEDVGVSKGSDTGGGRREGRRRLSGHVMADRAALLAARDEWLANSTAAAATYGAIGTWDVSRVEDFSFLFCATSGSWATSRGCNPACASFNDDISGWDVSGATTMNVRAASRLGCTRAHLLQRLHAPTRP